MEENKNLTDILKDLYDSLTDEQKAKVKECKTTDELMKLAGQEGIELPDEVLNAAAGGFIYQSASDGRWYIIDSHGKDHGGAYFDQSDAELAAWRFGQSTDVISEQQAIEWRKKC